MVETGKDMDLVVDIFFSSGKDGHRDGLIRVVSWLLSSISINNI